MLRNPMARLALAAVFFAGTATAFAQAGNPDQSPPSHPITVTPIPTGPPPTGQARLMPFPRGAAPTPTKPQSNSPELDRELVSRPISLDDAIAVALVNNPSLAAAGQSLYAAQGRLSEARAGFSPTVAVAPGESYIHRVAAEAYGIQATLPIDISHLVAAASDEAKFQEVAARLDINRTRNNVVYQVENAFYGALRAQALVNVADENLQNSMERLRDAGARYEARAVAYIDVVRAQTDVANDQRGVIQAKNTVSNAIALLANAMGIDVTTNLRITDQGAVVQPPNPEKPQPFDPMKPLPAQPPASGQPSDVHEAGADNGLQLGPEFRSVLAEALANRPEPMEVDADIAAAKKGVQVARRSELPSLAVSVGYYDLRTQSGSFVNEPQAYVGLSIPLYDGGVARARIQQANANVASFITQKRQVTDAVTLDVQQAYLSLVQARDQVAVAGQALTQAREGFSLAKVRYQTGVSARAGISPLLELSDAQAALTLAEQNQVNALYDYNAARAQLDRSAARFAYVGNGPGYPAVPSDKTLGK